MKKEDTNKKEFYESKTWYVLWPLSGAFWTFFIISVFMKAYNVDRYLYFKFAGCFVTCICLWLLVSILWAIFSQKESYIIVDKLRIRYKEKSFLTKGLLNTGRNQTFFWNEIKSVTLTYPPFGRNSKEEIKLNLRNGQEKWIFIHTLPKHERRLLLKAIQKYKEVQTDED